MGEILELRAKSILPPSGTFLRKTRGAFFLVEAEFTRRWMEIFDSCTNAVYFLLCSMADKQQKCWPSMNTIRAKVKFSKTNVMRSIRLLEFYELTTITRSDIRKPNIYWLTDKRQWKYPGEDNELVRPIDFIML